MSPLFVLNSWTEHCSSDKSSTFCRFCSFQHFCIFEPFPAVTVWFWDPSFHTEDNWWTQTQLLKKVQTFTDAPENTRCIKAGCWKLLNRMKISNFFLLLKYIYFSIYYCPSEATEDTCMFPGRQIKYNLPWSSNSKSFHPRLLMHRVFFWSISECLNLFNSCVESINCPQCEKMDLKIIQSLLETVQICKNAGKLQNLQNVEDLSEEQCSVQLFRTNKGLMNNQHKTKEQSWIIQVTSHSIKNQGFPNFWRGLFE